MSWRTMHAHDWQDQLRVIRSAAVNLHRNDFEHTADALSHAANRIEEDMGQAATKIGQLNADIATLQGELATANALAQTNQAAATQLATLTASGAIMDAADLAAVAEPDPLAPPAVDTVLPGAGNDSVAPTA